MSNKGHGKLGPTKPYDPKMLERFGRAWNDGVAVWAMTERFGIPRPNMHALARRMGLRKRAKP